MIAHARPTERKRQRSTWKSGFLTMMPDINKHALNAFRDLDPEGRTEAVQEVLVNAMLAYVRLFERGRVACAYPTVLARFAVAQYRVGRRVGAKLNGSDVLSPHAQRKNDIKVESLDRGDRLHGPWCEVLIEDKNAGPADTAAARLDFASWLDSLTTRYRKIADALSVGSTTSEVAKQFHVSPGRISQIRRQLLESSQRFHGEYGSNGANHR